MIVEPTVRILRQPPSWFAQARFDESIASRAGTDGCRARSWGRDSAHSHVGVPDAALLGSVLMPGSGLAIVMFTDLVGSTRLRDRLGDDVADEIGVEHDRIIGEALSATGGRLVKNLGDVA